MSTLERGTVKEQALKEAKDISSGHGPDFMVLAKPEDKWSKLEKTILDIVEEVFLNKGLNNTALMKTLLCSYAHDKEATSIPQYY